MRPGFRPLTRARSGAIACLLFLTCLLAGCTQWRYDLGRHIEESDAPPVSRGLTLSGVLVELGPPDRISALRSGYVLAWEHWHIHETTIGFSLGALGADLLSADWGEARIRGEFLLLTFDREHHLTASAFARWNNRAGGGQALQPLLSLMPLTDVDDLVDQMPQHRWGGSLLQPIPQALNSASRPDMGQSGIQRRGTPRAIGQQTLETDNR